MNIKLIKIQGFKSVANLSLVNVDPFMVFAGANGVGKSNIADALSFLGAVVARGAEQALREHGGFSQVHCFKYRKDKRTSMSFQINVELSDKLYCYSCKLINIDKSPRLTERLLVDEESFIERTDKAVKVKLFHEDKLSEFPDYAEDKSALIFLGHLPLYRMLNNIKVFRIDPFKAKEPDSPSADAESLDHYGSNVATVLASMEKNKEFREQIMDWIELIVPGMENVATEKQRLDSSTVITFKEEGLKTRFPAKLISDGTIYALAIMTAVLSRAGEDSLGITIIEEPERGIHPKAIGELVQLMRENANAKHPLIVTTHSESVVRNLQPEELWLVSKSEGKTQLKGARDSGVDTSEIPLDKAWLTNLLNGGLPW